MLDLSLPFSISIRSLWALSLHIPSGEPQEHLHIRFPWVKCRQPCFLADIGQNCSNWSSNTSGCCQTPSCRDLSLPEDLKHILAECDSLQSTRDSLMAFTRNISRSCPEIKPIVEKYCSLIHPDFIQFLLDCSVLPEVIQAQQQCGSQAILNPLFRITRTWCFCLHKARLKILGRWIKF